MKKSLVLVLNGEIKMEYDSSESLSGIQRRFLTKMDTDMDLGFVADGERIDQPDNIQRMQFVANQAVNAFLDNQDKMTAICFAYLTKSSPELTQIRIDTSTSDQTINLVFDNPKTS